MNTLIGIFKLGSAGLLFLSIAFVLFVNPDKPEFEFLEIAFVLVVTGVYGYYLIRTGIRDFKRLPVIRTWKIYPGLLLHLIFSGWAIAAASEDLSLYGGVIPFVLVAFLIGIRDLAQSIMAGNIKRSESVLGVAQVVQDDQRLEFTVNITEREWIRLIFLKSYSTPIILWATFIGLGMGAAAVSAVLSDSDYPMFGFVFTLIMVAFTLIYMPFTVWRQAVKQYRDDPWVKDPIHYSLSTREMNVTANDRRLSQDNSRMEIEEFKGWFIIKTGRQVGLYIPVRVMNEEQLSTFKSLCAGYRNHARYTTIS